jgi:CheY-like chemotaxis protein
MVSSPGTVGSTRMGTPRADGETVSQQIVPRSNAAVQALVVCLDTRTIDQVGEVLQTMSIEMETCVEPQAAIRRMGREKVDALFVDWHNRDAAREVLRFVRNSSSNRTVIVFAIAEGNGDAEDAFRSGAHFVIERPLTKSRLMRIMRTTYGLILRERRRYFRYPVAIPVFFSKSFGREVETVSLDISERGIAIMLREGAKTGDEVSVRFQLPGKTGLLRLKAQVCWCDEGRRAGLQFAAVPSEYAKELQEWMARRLEECTPTAIRAAVDCVPQ